MHTHTARRSTGNSSSTAAPDEPIDDLLDELGFAEPDYRRRARAVLEEAGLTRPGKQRIAARKRPEMERVLAGRLALCCNRTNCRLALPSDGRVVLAAFQPGACEVCGGRPNRAEVDRGVRALLDHGHRRVVVVGGAPSTHEELRDLVADRLELRLVVGTDRRNGQAARADLRWADLVVIWGSTELDHSVSKLYTDTRDPRIVTCPKRGIADLVTTLVLAAQRRRRLASR